ncbi:VOC family protein [Planctomonas sp. JC2975]|uniref:VOC family protein n=1 Tax=Planctomonas sp. JC2975 TaxID=2729626 RepID=UPI00147538CA|nr:VOC family protein [Planctomonas sp. JC2975]NNC13746.1 VOC family protein [Planctomonas sp. JC2975]
MAARLEAVAFDVADPSAVGAFWAGILGREVVDERDGVLVPGDEFQVGFRFTASHGEQIGRPWLHLHLASTDPDDQARIVEAALSRGAHYLDVGQEPDAPHVVLSDPGGNELCVLEPGNNWMSGTGFVGEVTCDGTRDVGFFWRDALGWLLVWDEGDQTAIQSPVGGTKISWDSWHRPGTESRNARNRQRFELVAADPSREAERLVQLGASRRAELSDGVMLADPDGNAFRLRSVP